MERPFCRYRIRTYVYMVRCLIVSGLSARENTYTWRHRLLGSISIGAFLQHLVNGSSHQLII